jgi:hypothetical protein
MQRRGESGQPVKGRRTLRPKARKAPTARVSATNLQEEVAALTRELKEAHEQQTATSESAVRHRPVAHGRAAGLRRGRRERSSTVHGVANRVCTHN